MSKRFYLPAQEIHGDQAVLRDREAHHAVRVMRMKVGEHLVLFDGEGREYQGTIREISKGEVVLSLERCVEENHKGVALSVACALPKHVQMERVIEKLTEAGVQTILPMITQRTVPRMKGAGETKKILRLKQIATEAAKQCGVSRLPEISRIFSFSEVLGQASTYPLALFLTPHGRPLQECLKGKAADRVIVAVGPEGGWSEAEEAEAEKSGWTLVSLGNRILKVETVSLAIVSILHYVLDAS